MKNETYDPKKKYQAVKRIRHPQGYFEPNDNKTFKLDHLTPLQIEYLVEVKKAVKPA